MAAMAEATQPATGERELAARLHKVNLDLLPVLHELLRTKSVTRTAQSFNMTQPAVSRALRQLRGALDDQLLVPSGRAARLTDLPRVINGDGDPGLEVLRHAHYFQRVITTRVPSPTRDALSNSFTRRLAPPSPRPRPFPEV